MADPKIFIRRSATPNKVPTTNQLALGELAINTYDGKLYLEKDPGGVGVGTTVVAVNPWTVGVGSLAYDTYFTAGNVGINSTSPTATLDVNGTLNVSGVSTFNNNVDIEGVNSILDVEGRIYTDLIVGNGRDLYIRGGGEQTNRPTILFPNNSSTALSILGSSNNTSGILIDSRSTGAVVIQHNSSTKFETTGVGVNVTGILTATEFHGNGSNITGIVSISDSSPSSPQAGDLWWESDTGDLKVYYDESKVGAGTSAFWVSTNAADTAVAISTDAPSPATSGDLWWDSNTGNLFLYYDDGDSAQWVDATGLSGAYPWVITGAGIHTTSNVGIGTENPQKELEVVGDAKIGIDTSQGVILTSPNGTEYRLIVDNSGNLSTVAV